MLCPNAGLSSHISHPSFSVHSFVTAMLQLPTSTKVIAIRECPKDRKPRYHDAMLEQRTIPPLQNGQVLVKIGAAAFNHRDVGILALEANEHM